MRTQYNTRFIFSALFTGLLLLLTTSISAQTIQVGNGSYTTTLPDGSNVPSSSADQPINPRVSSEFNQLIQTNDYWSNLIYPFSGSNHLNQTLAHPLSLESSQSGFKLGYFNTNTTSGNSYAYSTKNSIEISIVGITSNRTSAHAYGDWTFSAKMEFENGSLIATTGHGLPYTFFDVSGGDIQITSSSTFSVWHNVDEVIGVTIDGVHYALFAPTGSAWSGTQTLTSSLNDKGFLSVAVLPEATSETLEFFRSHAYAQVTNSSVSWNYDESSADLTSTFTYETILRDSAEGNIDETLTALYRHQWINTTDVLTNYTYDSPRGEMKVFEGNSFSTTSRFPGVLPSLPDEGSYDRIQLLDFVQQVANEDLPINNTYFNGVQMGRFLEVVHIADQLGAISERDYLLSELKLRLESWFTAGGEQQYYYNDTWNTLIGYPDSFGSAKEINDHHFHSAYAIKAAATIAQYDSAWASQENWGGMVNLIIQDANNWNRESDLFPFLRNFDAYAGHAWASGHGDHIFGNTRRGNNQESSSESINFASASILWGEITGQQEIRDLGIFLYTNETEAIDQYWFDIDNEVFPDDFNKVALGRVWGNGGDYNTWFGSDPEFIQGINFLPINGGSLYLAKNPDYIIENYNAMVSELGSQPTQWNDVFWQYLSMSDADLALSYYNADQNYTPFGGETRAHTLHWLYNMKEMGHYNTEVTADVPTYAVFVNETNDTTYIAFNGDPADKMIIFSDGFTLNVPARSLNSYSTAPSETMVSAPVPTEDSEKVISIFSDTYPSSTNATFNVDEGQSTITTIEVINGNNTLKYDGLDFQTTNFEILQNVSSRSTFHVDYWTEDATALAVYLISEDQSEQKFDFTITNSDWQSVEIPLTTFSEVNLFTISKIKVVGNGTVFIDNIYFSGDNPIPTGPSLAAPIPDLDSENVISIFSDTYIDIEGTDFNPNWEQSTITSIVSIADNSILKYENLNYQGTHFGDTLDVTEMGWFHLDYWTENATQLEIYLISPGPLETPFEITIRNSEWQRIDIPLSEFSEVVNLSEVYQIKIVGNGTVYFDNFYFGKNNELTVAPTPIHDEDKVVSLFSDAYTNNNTVDTWSASWDQATHEDIVINDNNVKFYSDLNFAGIEFIAEQIDATNLTHLRFDMMTQQPTDDPVQFAVRLVDFGANGRWSGGDDVEDDLIFNLETTPSLVRNQWISFDLPIDDFVDLTTRKNLAQLLFLTSGGLSEVYIDNIYFYGDAIINSTDEEIDTPSELKLEQNYPNPFNPSTNIEFSLPTASQVSLIIYNSIGQQVSKLLDTRLNQGAHSITWNAKLAPTGVYFYQLKTANATLTKRMLLIK
ncbi:MAG: hypothetical protein BalsKO_09880 [Balneolaceae bacterium]